MSKLFGFLKSKPPDMSVEQDNPSKIKASFSMVGPVSSGKSTIAAGIVHMCQCLSTLVPNFYAHVFPESTSILQDADNLKRGMFPDKTDPYLPRAPRAGLIIGHKKWKNKRVRIPIADVAGEVTDVLARRSQGFSPAQMVKDHMRNINREVINHVKDSDGLIIALPAPDALMLRDPQKKSPDVYTTTVLDSVLNYRRYHKKDDPEIAVVLTKWDKAVYDAKELGMDAYHGGLERFLANGFPSTEMLLKPLRDDGKVHYFRSYFQTKKREDGSDMYWPGSSKPIINILERPNEFIRFVPEMAEQDYADLINYIGSLAR